VMAIYRARWEEEDRLKREEGEKKGIVRAPEPEPEEPLNMGTPDDKIGAKIDVSSSNSRKFDALAAHASQIADSFWMKMGKEQFMEVMVNEWFFRVTNPKNLDGCVDDIFAGYR